MNSLITRLSSMGNPFQRYIDTPKAGYLPPQPNNDMAMTKFVKWVFRLK